MCERHDAERSVAVDARQAHVIAAAQARRLSAHGARAPSPGRAADDERDERKTAALLQTAAQRMSTMRLGMTKNRLVPTVRTSSSSPPL